jgi:hypothetical protein
MGEPTIAPAFPEPYLQPDRNKDCGYYAQAYLCRCLGHPEVTAGQVMSWREETRTHEARYAANVLGADIRHLWHYQEDEAVRRLFWLGPGTRDWVLGWLAHGWIAQVALHRIKPMGHGAVLLDADDDHGVILMDPIYGHVLEPWDWFLGPGPKDGRADWPGSAPDGREFYGCTYIEGWYRPARSEGGAP